MEQNTTELYDPKYRPVRESISRTLRSYMAMKQISTLRDLANILEIPESSLGLLSRGCSLEDYHLTTPKELRGSRRLKPSELKLIRKVFDFLGVPEYEGSIKLLESVFPNYSLRSQSLDSSQL